MKRAPYPAYKPSGVAWLGDVPAHWEVKRGRYCLQVNPPAMRLKSLSKDDEVSFIPMEAVGEYGGLTLDETKLIGEVGSGFTEFEDGDVVVAKITPCFENGKGALAKNLVNGVAFGTTELHVLRTAKSLLNTFLFYLTISWAYRKTGEAEMYGAGGQKRVPTEFNKDVFIPLPSLSEQQAIAGFLDRETAKLDELIGKKRKLIEVLQEKRSALISRTVTRGLPPAAAQAAGLDPHPPMKPSGIDWLGEVPAHWELPPLYLRYKIELGKMLDEKRKKGTSLMPYLRNVDVQWDRINTDDLPEMDIAVDEYDRYTLIQGDLLVCEGGEVGRAAIFQGSDSVIGYQKAIHRLRPLQKSEVSRYMYYIFVWAANTGIFIAEGNPNTISHLTGEKLRRYRFQKPPEKEQVLIARFLDAETIKIDKMIVKVEVAIKKLQEYRAALITAAVTGKIDVRDRAA